MAKKNEEPVEVEPSSAVESNETVYKTKISTAKNRDKGYLRTTFPKQLAEKFGIQLGDKIAWHVVEANGGAEIHIDFEKGV